MLMNEVFISIILGILGLLLGSFAGASVWRLRARELAYYKSSGKEYDHAEYKKLKKLNSSKLLNDRSTCLNCDYKLRWYDLIPLFSWIKLGGKCRKCRHNIGYMEPLIEFGLALFFVVSFLLWPLSLESSMGIISIIVWLMAGVGLAIMTVYDTKWFMLPDGVNYSVIGLGLIASIVTVVGSDDKLYAVGSVFGSVLILGGLYYLLYVVSKHKWVGFGDVKLGIGLGLLLADWRLAFIALFMANLVGSLIVIPLMLLGKIGRKSRVPFGPMLIAGAVIAMLVGNLLFEWYISLLY